MIIFKSPLGMVAQCAGCNNYPVWASLIIGAMGGAVFHGVHWLEMKARMDDPLDAVPVHFGGGVLGVICGPIFKVCLDIFFPNA